jgi:hypothetical protein
MASPFLEAHEAQDNFFWLSAGLAPISIRDQIVRGVSVIQHALAENRIQADDLALIVGAGAAGVSAALQAQKENISCVLVDRQRGPFLVQARAGTRWIDPTQYDWPLEHWRRRVYPWQPPGIPLPWVANWAPLIAAAWHRQFRSAMSHRIQLRFSTAVASIIPTTRPSTSNFAVKLTNGEVFNPKIVVWTTGFGREDCQDPKRKFAGIPFWATDPFTTIGLGTGKSNPDVFISGAGDGGLQDYLRICTGLRSAEEIYRRAIQGTPLERSVMTFLRDAEDLAHRAWLWSGNKELDHNIHAMLQTRHKQAANALLGHGAYARLNRLIATRSCQPILAYRCDHFTNFYALNRLLVLLIARFLFEKFGMRTLLPRVSLQAVTSASASHTCNPTNPWGCLHYKHDVTITHDPECWVTSRAATSHRITTDLVLIRHGADTSGIAPPGMGSPAANLERKRHSIPYHLIS